MKFLLLILIAFPLWAEEWVVPTHEEAQAKLKAALTKHPGDHIEREVRRLGNRILEFEGFASTEADTKWVPRILADLGVYNRWVLPKINDRPSGDKYHVQLMNLMKVSENPSILQTHVTVSFPLFTKNLVARFKITTIEKDGVTTWLVESLPDEKSVVDWANAVVKVFPVKGSPNRAWIYMKAGTKIRNWLLYEALPEKILRRETVERLGVLLSNYLAEEDRLMASQSRSVSSDKK